MYASTTDARKRAAEKFKIGDRVRITNTLYPNAVPTGSIGVIDGINWENAGRTCYGVTVDAYADPSFDWSFYDNELELVAAADETAPMWSPLFEEVHHNVTYKPGYRLLLKPDTEIPNGRWYYQVEADRVDVITGQPGTGRGGKAYLSPHMTRSELVQVAFGLFKGYEEHETREHFQYQGRRVYGPHIDVLYHWAIADNTDYRAQP